MLFDPTRSWVHRGSCRTVDPRKFFTDSGPIHTAPPARIQAQWAAAKRICGFCPVLAECRRDSLGEEYGVWGGLDEHERHQLRRALPKRVAKWPPEERLEWGKALHALRGRGASWPRVRSITGMSDGVASGLIADWLEHLETTRPASAGQVVDLPLPAPPVDFPQTPGFRHAWVRHNGLVADAYYRGETEDGEWISVQIRAGRGNTVKWVRRADVQLHHEVPRVVIEYIGRSAREQSQQRAG